MSNSDAEVVDFYKIYEDELGYVKKRRIDLIKERFEELVKSLHENGMDDKQKAVVETELCKTIEALIKSINEYSGKLDDRHLINAWCDKQISICVDNDKVSKLLAELKELLKKDEKDHSTISDSKQGDNKESTPNVEEGLVGLCFSGGGIRSATFNLGLVQSMAKTGVFKLCDYLSTISGGSYIGSCISSLLSREGSKTHGKEFPFYFAGGDKEKKSVRHLRNHSNFLTPHMGLFSLDTWYMVAILVRGMALNFTILLSFLTAVLSGSVLAFVLPHWDREPWKHFKDENSWFCPDGYFFHITIILVLLTFSIFIYPFITKWKYSFKIRKCYGTGQVYIIWALLAILTIKLLPPAVQYMETWVNGIIGGASFASLFGIFKYSDKVKANKNILKKLIPVVIPIFLVGIAIYIMGEWLVPKNSSMKNGVDLQVIGALEAWRCKVWWIFSGSGVLFFLFGFVININRISLHNFYKDRITETYIFKSRDHKKTTENPDNEEDKDAFVYDDELLLKNLHKEGNGAPYHLINSTLNLTGENDLNLCGRKSDMFIFSKKYCGSDITKYRKTDQFRKDDVTLCRAATVSGAAISPQSGSSTVSSISFLMTLMNARVGYWMPNPKYYKPLLVFWPWYLLKELFSNTVKDDRFCSLADGAFTENLGIYQLVKRRCKYIIASDVGADFDLKFDDLANVLRKVRIDLGVQINMDLEMLRKNDSVLSKRHCVAGVINYSEKEKGILLYIKSSLTGDEPEDLFQYRKEHPTFPYESTADQFFDEAQFESYRQLGYHVGQKVFSNLGIDVDNTVDSELCAEVFGKLLSKWRAPAPSLGKESFGISEVFMQLNEIVRDNPGLEFYDLENYPELQLLVKDPSDRPDDLRLAFHYCNTQIRLMENAWRTFNLGRYYNHPDNRGWMNLFNRWVRSDIFKMVWHINKGIYGKNFQNFFESHLPIPKTSDVVTIKIEDKLDENICNEFANILSTDQMEMLTDSSQGNEIWTIKNNIGLHGEQKFFVMGIAMLTSAGEGVENKTKNLEFIVIRNYLQRLGLGKLFFDSIKTDLRKNGVECVTSADYFNAPEPVKGFYYRLGFRESEDKRVKLFI